MQNHMKTIKKILGKLVVPTCLLIALGPIVWIAASGGLLGDVEFGYYGAFNTAKHAIQQSECAEVIEYSGVNKDVFLEEFHFKVTTKTGRIIRIWFDASNMDVDRLCYGPVGLCVWDEAHERSQLYTTTGLSQLLKEKNIEIRGLKDILCNLDELKPFFKNSQGDANDISETDPYAWDYLRIEFPTEKRLQGYHYANINETDVIDVK